MKKIKIDMNSPEFQKSLFELEKNETNELIKTLKKIAGYTWNELYKDHGVKWEKITSKQTANGESIYSFRFSKKYRE